MGLRLSHIQHLKEAPGFEVAFEVEAEQAVHDGLDLTVEASVQAQAGNIAPLAALQEPQDLESIQ